jgi:hypothetical protein
MALDAVNNFVKVTVSTGYNASATSIVLNSGQGASLPAAPFNLTWWNSTDYPDPADDPNVEIVRVTNVSTDTLTVTRAYEGPAASTKNTAGKTYKMSQDITQYMMTQIGNLIVGIRPALYTTTTAGGDTSFAITPPSNSVTAILMVVIGTQQLFPGGGNDYQQSGNSVNLNTAYPNANAPVIILYTY